MFLPHPRKSPEMANMLLLHWEALPLVGCEGLPPQDISEPPPESLFEFGHLPGPNKMI